MSNSRHAKLLWKLLAQRRIYLQSKHQPGVISAQTTDSSWFIMFCSILTSLRCLVSLTFESSVIFFSPMAGEQFAGGHQRGRLGFAAPVMFVFADEVLARRSPKKSMFCWPKKLPYLVGGLEHVFFEYTVFGITIPMDWVETTNQLSSESLVSVGLFSWFSGWSLGFSIFKIRTPRGFWAPWIVRRWEVVARRCCEIALNTY